MQSAQRKFDYDESTYAARKRVVKMQGNVAYISNDPVRPGTRTRPATQTRPAQKVQAKQKQQSSSKTATKPKAAAKPEQVRSRKGLVSTLFVIFVAFCALSLMVSRYAALCSIGVQNHKIKESIEMLEGQIDKVQLDMELRDNIEYVQNTALDELGMAYPSQDQKITIDMSG